MTIQLIFILQDRYMLVIIIDYYIIIFLITYIENKMYKDR